MSPASSSDYRWLQQNARFNIHVVVLILVTPEKLPVIFLSSHSDVLHQKNDLQAGAIEKGIHSKYVYLVIWKQSMLIFILLSSILVWLQGVPWCKTTLPVGTFPAGLSWGLMSWWMTMDGKAPDSHHHPLRTSATSHSADGWPPEPGWSLPSAPARVKTGVLKLQ